MRSIYKKFYMISATRPEFTEKENEQRNYELLQTLLDFGETVITCKGVWEGVSETSFMVFNSFNTEENIIQLTEIYNQDAYLIRHEDNSGELVFSGNKRENIGNCKEVSFEIASKEIGYTGFLDQGKIKYFIFK